MRKFVFTCGDVNGIGPEIVIKTLNRLVDKKNANGIYFVCPSNVFNKIISLVKPRFEYSVTSAFIEAESGIVTVLSPGSVKIDKCKATEESGAAAFNAIELAFALLKNNHADAVITAPISKNALNLAGVEYTGHTEMFADWSGVTDYAMTFLSPRMNAALATIHVPVGNVPKYITSNRLESLSNIILKTLTYDLAVEEPSIAVLGLNPHAGENGLIGKEEEEIIKPFLQRDNICRYFSGPYSPDAFFANKVYKNYDMILGMYHDQILIPFKLLNFNAGVNYTAGLPVVRTSPDHGTAYDIAWKNLASESSMFEAFKYADKIVNNRLKNARRKQNIL